MALVVGGFLVLALGSIEAGSSLSYTCIMALVVGGFLVLALGSIEAGSSLSYTCVMALVVGGFLVLALGSIEAGSSLSYTCVLCRLGRVDTTLFGFKRSTYHENECSRWYPQNVEPSHTHIWERGTCRTLLNALAQPMGVGCQPGRYPILLLSPSTQMNVYQHIKDRQKAKELFGNLTDAKTHDDRLDEHDESKGHLIVRSIKEWEAAGFPGTWDDWWDRW